MKGISSIRYSNRDVRARIFSVIKVPTFIAMTVVGERGLL
tara:strand:+ start:247 stop:366 length:120 start_codon:yes stop_codon:yes gene_type:complete